jgi:hypothetical protein
MEGEVDAQALLEIYKEQSNFTWALENELNKQGLGGSGQECFREDERDRKTKILIKVLRTETLPYLNPSKVAENSELSAIQ